MKINYTNWSRAQLPHPKEGFLPAVLTAVAVIGTFLFSRTMRGRSYTIHMKDYPVPVETIIKVPGVYITKEENDDELNMEEREEGRHTQSTARGDQGQEPTLDASSDQQYGDEQV